MVKISDVLLYSIKRCASTQKNKKKLAWDISAPTTLAKRRIILISQCIPSRIILIE
jgi:hypothetical protein